MTVANHRDNRPGVVLAALNQASAQIMEAQLQEAVRVTATACDAEETERLIKRHHPAAVLFDPMIENIEASLLRIRDASRRPLLVALLSGRAGSRSDDRESAVSYADVSVLRPGKQMSVESFRQEAARILAESAKQPRGPAEPAEAEDGARAPTRARPEPARRHAERHGAVGEPPAAPAPQGQRRRALNATTATGRPAETEEKHHPPERRKAQAAADPAASSETVRAKPLSRPLRPVAAVTIASSTGGPDALSLLFRALKGTPLRGPIFITQHMPPQFTAMLAARLSKESGLLCREGADKLEPAPGEIYVAPGDFHMRLERVGAGVRIRLDKGEKEHFCRPAADPLLRSAAAVYGAQLLGVVMTGMGSDGAMGAAEIKRNGGAVIIQTKESSAVWGMPGAAYALGAYDAIMPPDEIGATVAQALNALSAPPVRRAD